MAKIPNYTRMKSKEKITNRGTRDGMDKEIIRYYQHDTISDIFVVVRREKTPGIPAMYRVMAGRLQTGADSNSHLRTEEVIAKGLNKDRANRNKLTKKEAISEAQDWMRNHPEGM